MEIYSKEYYQNNRERIIQAAKEWKKNNSKKVKTYFKIYYQKNKEKCKQIAFNWKTNNKKQQKVYEHRTIIQMKDFYIRKLLKQQFPWILASEITPELVQMKREQLTVYRLLKQIKETIREKDYYGNRRIKTITSANHA